MLQTPACPVPVKGWQTLGPATAGAHPAALPANLLPAPQLQDSMSQHHMASTIPSEASNQSSSKNQAKQFNDCIAVPLFLTAWKTRGGFCLIFVE